jgi:hypothetical protein
VLDFRATPEVMLAQRFHDTPVISTRFPGGRSSAAPRPLVRARSPPRAGAGAAFSEPLARSFLLNSPGMVPIDQQESLPALFAEHLRMEEHESRLEFLYSVVKDSQETIRFLDTKAGFCVTLLTAMMAAAFGPLAHPTNHRYLHDAGITGFTVTTLFALMICLRVIFPTIHLQGTFSAAGPAAPAFFLPPKGNRSKFRALWGGGGASPLGLTHDNYMADVMKATDIDLVRSMCDEVILVSAIRQLKSDRLHAAIITLFLAMALFFIQLVV